MILAQAAMDAVLDDALDPDNSAFPDDPGVKIRGMCSRFVRCVTRKVYGIRYANHFGATAKETGHNFVDAGLGVYIGDNGDSADGDVLVGVSGHGPYGHIVIRVDDRVYENSSAHPDGYVNGHYVGAKGSRLLSDAGDYQIRIALPAPVQQPDAEHYRLIGTDGKTVALMPVLDGHSWCPARRWAQVMGFELDAEKDNSVLLNGILFPDPLRLIDGIGYLPAHDLIKVAGLDYVVDAAAHQVKIIRR